MTELSIQEVMQLLPHRYPFLLIDRILDYKLKESIVAIKNVTINEFFFAGHFPQRPVMPGVLILEAMAQAAGVLAFLSLGGEPTSDEIYYFAAIDNARFKRVVEPGDQLRIEVKLLKVRRDVIKAEAIATVDGEIACSAILMSVKRGAKE
ncbi:MAG: 3-hydroxyacyl-ACP dehydratase FabZ [Gammaproteobacteria bacterium]|nr:3-hydroxyacyl-ACP dehydratase FabZ [Gammaproteobacteria bacterium]